MTLAHMTAESIINALANAFGGMSQIPDNVIGEAVHGRHNNGGLGGQSPADVIEAATEAVYSYWMENGADLLDVRADIQRGFDAAAARIAAVAAAAQ